MKPMMKYILLAAVLVAVAAGTLLTYVVGQLPSGGQTSTVDTTTAYSGLPPGCVKPAGGFLVIANQNGFNDSIQHGAPQVQWPVINVTQGTTVNITVCNSDFEAHGFQITHYFDSNIEAVEPGQVVHVSFVANKVGDFDIYCSIFCAIHPFMQNGLFQVTA